MVDALVRLIPGWAGQANRARCFDHIVNLCAKSFLKPFDVERAQVGVVMDDAAQALVALAEGLDDGDDDGEDDDVDGFIDERAALDNIDREELDGDIFPVKVLLTKVSQ